MSNLKMQAEIFADERNKAINFYKKQRLWPLMKTLAMCGLLPNWQSFKFRLTNSNSN